MSIGIGVVKTISETDFRDGSTSTNGSDSKRPQGVSNIVYFETATREHVSGTERSTDSAIPAIHELGNVGQGEHRYPLAGSQRR